MTKKNPQIEYTDAQHACMQQTSLMKAFLSSFRAVFFRNLWVLILSVALGLGLELGNEREEARGKGAMLVEGRE